MLQAPATRLGAAQASSVAWTPGAEACSLASMSAFSVAKSAALMTSLAVPSLTLTRLAAGTPRAAT
jgi:hypothetical protein